ncbi:hypothetical protein BT96DRAFT_996513 [Gymnopus androsaceus JB14]|uniref:Uncharacterized protein n=1 Tax=Gymnopus androsaceus JB14 TaxID=1447944 RepID=A0A6A4HFQ4_9AGAR|nr:hypothetical protein BT96DRAFT_996513 [Gymnopus androsaceus JB14]
MRFEGHLCAAVVAFGLVSIVLTACAVPILDIRRKIPQTNSNKLKSQEETADITPLPAGHSSALVAGIAAPVPSSLDGVHSEKGGNSIITVPFSNDTRFEEWQKDYAVEKFHIPRDNVRIYNTPSAGLPAKLPSSSIPIADFNSKLISRWEMVSVEVGSVKREMEFLKPVEQLSIWGQDMSYLEGDIWHEFYLDIKREDVNEAANRAANDLVVVPPIVVS